MYIKSFPKISQLKCGHCCAIDAGLGSTLLEKNFLWGVLYLRVRIMV